MFTYLVIFPGQPGFYTNSYSPDNFEAGMIVHNLNNATQAPRRYMG